MPPKFSREIEEKFITRNGLKFQPRTSPCETSCPAGNPIQKVHALLEEERVEEALAYLRSRNPFPAITGRVCSGPCEAACNRSQYDEKIAIRALERFAADQADFTRVSIPKKRRATGKRLAVIGSGPAGMTCAYFSALFGHEVTVFESSSILGGMPRAGVPDFRLPKDVVDREMGRILALGIAARTNTAAGRDISLDELKKDFDACLIAVGTWKERLLDVPGTELARTGVAFLKSVNLGLIKEIGKTVAIVGGGGVAFDCALTARRLGASDIHLFCLEDEENMCASQEDIQLAEAEGVHIHHATVASRILEQEGLAKGLEYYGIASFEFDEKGEVKVQPSSQEKLAFDAETVISAIGVKPDLSIFQDRGNLEVTVEGTLAVDSETLATSVDGVFGAGDAVWGPSTVAQAIGSGRQAALSIDRYLRGNKGPQDFKLVRIDGDNCVRTHEIEDDVVPRVVPFEEILSVDAHEKREGQLKGKGGAPLSFEEMDKDFGVEEAPVEAGRCLHCGHCTSCGRCVEDCPGFVLEMTQTGPKVVHFDECWHCGCCRIACPSGAVYYEFPLNMMV